MLYKLFGWCVEFQRRLINDIKWCKMGPTLGADRSASCPQRVYFHPSRNSKPIVDPVIRAPDWIGQRKLEVANMVSESARK
jgi:hypothetical protein